MAKGFTLNQLADYFRVSKKRTVEVVRDAGVVRRVKYIAGEDLDGTGKPVYERFTQAETSAIIQEFYRQRGAAEELRRRRAEQKGPVHLRGPRRSRPAPEDD